MGKIVLYIVSIIVNIVYFVILRADIYLDRYYLPNDEMREKKLSPMDRLYHADLSWLFYLELLFMAVSIITSILLLFGVKNSIIRITQIVSTVASTVMFIVIMIVSGNIHLKY